MNRSDAAPAPLLLTARETADALRLCRKSVWHLTRTGRLRAVRIGRRVLYDAIDLRRFIESSKDDAR